MRLSGLLTAGGTTGTPPGRRSGIGLRNHLEVGDHCGIGVRTRAARCRELIARGRRPAVVARMLQVNRSGLYRTPNRRPAAARRAVLVRSTG